MLYSVLGGILAAVCLYFLAAQPNKTLLLLDVFLMLGRGIGIFYDETYIKLIMILVIIYSLVRCEIVKKYIPEFLLITLLVLLNGVIAVQHLSFGKYAASSASLLLGFFLLLVNWKKDDILFFMRILTYVPTICILLGVLYYGRIYSIDFSTGQHKIVTITATAYLVFQAVLGFLSAWFLWQNGYLHSWGMMAVNCIIGLATLQRMGSLMLLLCLGSALYQNRRVLLRSKLYVCGIIVLSPVIFIIAYLFISSFIQRTFSSAYLESSIINTSSRSYMWSRLLELSKEHRITGFGLGYVMTIDRLAYWTSDGHMAAHNEYIRFIVETGYAGMICIVSVFCSIFRKLCSSIREHKAFPVLAAVIFFPLYSFTDNTVSNAMLFYSFIILLRMISLYYEKYCTQEELRCV